VIRRANESMKAGHHGAALAAKEDSSSWMQRTHTVYGGKLQLHHFVVVECAPRPFRKHWS
jgi:hypothetical protein